MLPQSAIHPRRRASSARALASSTCWARSRNSSASLSISSEESSVASDEKSDCDSVGNGMAHPTYGSPCARAFSATQAAELATTTAGKTFSKRPSPSAALCAKSRRASRTFFPASHTVPPNASAMGMHESTSPAPKIVTPRRPRLSTQASSTLAMVTYAATEFDPAIAAASATGCTSYERDITHSADAAANTSEMLTSRATATATVV